MKGIKGDNMAGVGRPSTKNTKNKVENKTSNLKIEKKSEEKEVKKSYNELENEISELKEMVKTLLSSQSSNSEKNEKEVTIKTSVKNMQEEYVEIPLNKRIPVISLYDGILVLTTDKNGQGKPFEFQKFGTTININYSDLVEILHYQKSFAEKGLFYIYDRNVISNNGLQDTYEKILDKEMIDNILSLSKSELNEVFSKTTDAQKDIIVSIITSKIRNNEDIDLNKVDIISKIYKRDIIETANEGIFREEKEE